jgi:hypothetical protein
MRDWSEPFALLPEVLQDLTAIIFTARVGQNHMHTHIIYIYHAYTVFFSSYVFKRAVIHSV